VTSYETVLLAISLGFDAFSVAMSIGAVWNNPRQIFRLSWHFGLFQAMMPLFGWYFGNFLYSFVSGWSGIAACIILAGIGSHMIWNAATGKKECSENDVHPDRTRGMSLVFLSIATSIDAFGAGVSLGLVTDKILRICVVIGVTASLMTIIGMYLGKKMSCVFGERMEIVAGLVLILLGLKMAMFR